MSAGADTGNLGNTPGKSYLTDRHARALRRRMRFADNVRLGLDGVRLAARRPRRMADIQWGYYGAVTAYDLLEWLLAAGRAPSPGRPHLAALSAGLCLRQNPRYRSYWYDPGRHAMVGSFLGLDLHRHAGRYYVLESNLTAGLMPERRALYPEVIDPFVTTLIAFAKRHGFRKIVLQRRSWRKEHVREFGEAGRAEGISIVPVSVMREDGDPMVNPVVGLPDPPERDTLYVACTAISENAAYQFLHQKTQLESWLPRALGDKPEDFRLLAALPGAPGPWVSQISEDPRWPNLVVKLANSDEGRDILMGRFSSEQNARSALGLPPEGRGLPQQFLRRPGRYLINKLFSHAFTPVYQSFVPPEDVDGYPRMIRMEIFISPLEDAFLSAHGTIGADRIPSEMPLDQVFDRSPLNVSVPPGRFVRLDTETEAELVDVAREFGLAARIAWETTFDTGPESPTFDQDT